MRTPMSYFEKATGVFVLVMLGLLGAAVFVAAQRNNMFSTRQDFEIATFVEKGYGIVVGSKVFIRDAEAGFVTDAALVTMTARPRHHEHDRPIRVTMRVVGDFPKYLSADTVAVVNQQPIGGTKIDLQTNLEKLDNHDVEALANGATIESDVPESLLEKLGKIKDDVTAVKEDILKTLKNVQDIIANVKTSTDTIARGEGTIGRVIHDPKMAQDLADTVTSVRAVAAEVQTGVMADVRTATANATKATTEVTALVDDLRASVKKADRALDPLPEMMAGVARALRDVEAIMANVRTASGGFPELARKTDRALDETNRTIDAAQRTFLLRGNMGERAPLHSEAEALPRGGLERD
jgi:phospholipid/cholesterol/gamma-HCH transport system substrate-binding protein